MLAIDHIVQRYPNEIAALFKKYGIQAPLSTYNVSLAIKEKKGFAEQLQAVMEVCPHCSNYPGDAPDKPTLLGSIKEYVLDSLPNKTANNATPKASKISTEKLFLYGSIAAIVVLVIVLIKLKNT